MYHFFLTLPTGEVRAISSPFLPRVGDTITIEKLEIHIDKVEWICNGSTIADDPMMSGHAEPTAAIPPQLHGTPPPDVYPFHAIGSSHPYFATALSIAKQYPDKKITAIKEFRAVSDWGLKEAKDMMDYCYRWIEAQP